VTTMFCRPGHMHRASKVLSASSEAGLIVAPPTPESGNTGTLRLRTSGRPTTAAALNVELQTGGNPSGYALTTSSGQGAGAAVVWKKTSDAAGAGTLHWRGYVDTPYLVRVDYPIAYGTGLGKPSTPRTLGNGNLGFLTDHSPGTASSLKFTSVTPITNVATTVDIDATTFSSGTQSDFVVLPSGRLVAIRVLGFSLTRYTSSDHGATWSDGVDCGSVLANQDTIALEYVDDLLVMVVSSSTAAAVTEVRVSQDEGFNFTTVDNAQTLRGVRTCVTPTGTILAIASAAAPLVRTLAPGGGLSTSTVDADLTCNTGRVAIVTRDDGTNWAFCTNSTAGSHLDIDASVSIDGGTTWTNPLGGLKVLNGNTTNTNAGWSGISAGCWAGRVVILALSRSSGGAGASDYAIHMYTLGGWETLTEGDDSYNHGLVPVDLPENFTTPWTRNNTGAGATVTNQGPLRFVSTGANATYYVAPSAVVTPTNAGGSYRLRYRCVQSAGGSLTSNSNGFRFTIDDGVNRQGFALRCTTTQFRIVDSAGNTLGVTKTADMTKVTDFLFAFKHDNVAGASGLLSYWYKQDGDETWTLGFASVAVPEEAGVTADGLRVGGATAVAGTHDLYWLGIADSSDNMEGGFTNPDDLVGRSLTSAADFYLYAGIHLGGRNAGGVPGDGYTVQTTYSFGKESIWRELRPSKKCHSSADNASWNVVFDAGSTDTFKGNLAALFGTNFRTATLQFNTTDSWGAPAASVSLDATVVTSTVGALNRGPGYFGPAVSLDWRPGQFKSDGDAHRYFVDVGGTVYEITDNDEERLFVEGTDFSAAAGTFYIFGDKMAATTTFKQYRFMRLLVGAQQTPAADDCYHVGTLIFDKSFTPAQLYDHGFVDRVEPRVELFEADTGYRSHARIGPRRHTLAIQWPPIAYQGPASDLEHRLRDFYAALEGRPFVFWRDTSLVATVGLYTFNGIYQATNVWGELSTALTRVDQLVLEEHH
jgi:hypothetical protein